MEFPEDVTDKKAYIKYTKLSKHRILNEDTIQKASDGEDINVAWFPHIVRKKIEHLPLDEQKHFLEEKELYSSINNNATVQKRLAFGLKQGRGAGKDGTPSLLDLRGPEIIEYFGRLFTPQEILKVINQDWGIDFRSVKQLQDFRKRHAKEIAEEVEKFKASHSDVRLAVKRSRLEEYTYLYGQQKEKYENSRSDSSYKLLLDTLEKIRKESEGDRLTIDGKVDINYEQNLQGHLRNEIFKTINLKEIIIGRVAARMGVSPVKLIHSLNNSFYKKFSNVLGDFNPEEGQDEQTFPSQMGYDFERIGKSQRMWDRLAEDAVIEEEKGNADKDGEKAAEIKRLMLEKLKKKKAKLNTAKSTIIADDKNKNGK